MWAKCESDLDCAGLALDWTGPDWRLDWRLEVHWIGLDWTGLDSIGLDLDLYWIGLGFGLDLNWLALDWSGLELVSGMKVP